MEKLVFRFSVFVISDSSLGLARTQDLFTPAALIAWLEYCGFWSYGDVGFSFFVCGI